MTPDKITIDQAIERSKGFLLKKVLEDSDYRAIQLGFEGLERLKEIRKAEFILASSEAKALLPSEAEGGG